MDLEKMLQEAVAKALEAQKPAAEAQPEMVSKAQVEEMLTALRAEYDAKLTELTAKAEAAEREGLGRKAVVGAGDELTLETDPVAYIVKKSRTVDAHGSQYTADEKAFIANLTMTAILDGLKD